MLRLIALIAAGTLLGGVPVPRNAEAGDIKVLASSGVRGVMIELGPQFEAATGHKLVMDFEVIAVLKRRILAGEPFDLAIIGPAAIDELIGQGKVAAGTRAPFGRTGLGVAAREGAPRPEIGTADALKRVLLDAKSVAHSKEGESGIHFHALLDRLGIAGVMEPKLKAYDAAGLRQSLASGEAEFAVTGIGPILSMPKSQYLAPAPPDQQTYVVFNTGVSASAQDPAAVRALIAFLTAPAAAPVFKAKGMEPG